MPMELQPKLLRALQERCIRPVGGRDEVSIDVRVIAASNDDLDMRVQRGQFRSDLYYRLAVVELALPPLRERGEDVLLLAQHFLWRVTAATHTRVVGFTPAAARMLLRYDWPGNVRELQNAIEAAVAVARFDHIRDTELPRRLHQSLAPMDGLLPLEQVERTHISRVMQLVNGNKAEASRILGITRKTLYRKLQQHDIDVDNVALQDDDPVNPNE
jgi:DNA-binding NtrC family response regulator